MLPLYLSVEGLYSYQKKQEIDFTQLTEAGLFGIFGHVGSGKSSILEAIGFVLYGETERLNKQEKRTYNMLNLKSDAACIVFEFLNFENRKFRFVAQWKRKKRFEETSTLERFAYEWQDTGWLPMDSADGGLVTNLTYANFRRTIIIPQGQFKEFLELKGKDRSDMMKEIFNLNRFDLGPKTALLQRANNSKIEHVKGALSGFETVSAEILAHKLADLKDAQELLSTTKTATLALEEQCAWLIQGKQNRTALAAKKQELNVLHGDKPRIEQLDKELRTYETTNQVFREILNVALRLNKDKEQLTYKIEQLSVKKKDTLERLEEKEQQWLAIAEDFNKLEIFRAELEDLKLLISNAQNHEKLTILTKRLNDGKPFLEKEQNVEHELSAQITSKEENLEELKTAKVDTAELLALENWYQANDSNQAQITDIQQRIDKYQTDIEEIKQIFADKNFTSENWEEQLAEQERTQEAALTELRKTETHLKVQLKLAEFADNLHAGHSCPLCGSLAHPDPMVAHGLEEKEQELEQQKAEIKQRILAWKENSTALNRAATRLKDMLTQQQQWSASLLDAQKKQSYHLNQFQWRDFSATDKSAFLQYKNKSKLAEDSIKQVEQEIKTLRQQLTATQGKVEKYKVSLSEFEQEITVLNSLTHQNIAQLRALKAADFTENSPQSLADLQEKTGSKIKFLEQSHRTLSEELNLLKTALATVNAERGIAKEQFQQLAQQHNQKQSEISSLLAEHGFNDTMQVQQILQKNLNSEAIRQTIQEFVMQLHLIQNKIAELEQLITDDQYNEQVFEEKTQLLRLKQQELEMQIRLTGALEKECAHLQVEVAKKEKLVEEYEKLNVRKANLTTLENLFRGSGFVNYVSSIHLQRLCEIANIRFRRLTKNSLSLTVNESNEFEVIDYLNNGYQRSVKTLSGGQSFQASLCLALALAENIQALNRADRNFFFIDEGFGTQDIESINAVFETLQYLHRENRIVGIISHVEELKERIPRSITVTNDTEHGSQIKYN
ncbi:SMC family ATPase [Sphingobacterium psychroaquaticum]|uniref:AAA family ATPase n=1 Tax=Sphingobacterium psychroaquaticum TaxID=561061 RepID=UPI00106AF1FF|nr:SMC family ATPase [Sphingobacterium psychroaquaticum]QBQ41598.1 SMC family ATPase [Sphingobacterium psychroaquaticum]